MKFLPIVCFILITAAFSAGADDPKPDAKPSINIAAGTVSKINAEKKSFEIKMADDKTQEYLVGEQTRFTKDDKELQFADLAVGNYLRFTFSQNADGSLTARRVFVSEKAPTEEKPEPPKNEQR
jgi:hypothetical protein